MDIYKIKSFIIILIIYLIALLPTIIIFLKNNTCNSKKNFLKTLSICSIIEIIIFSLIYAFPRTILSFFKVPINIENYSFYALKILFVASILTPIHYTFPIYLFKNQKKKKAIILFSLKIIYIPILFFINFVFNTKFALFTMPILDFIYSSILLFYLYII